MVNSWIAHVKNYAATHNVPYPVAMIQAKASYKKMSGGMSLKDFGLQQYDKVPDAYKPGIESLAQAAYHTGFGVKKTR
jgi:hypothetical protein